LASAGSRCSIPCRRPGLRNEPPGMHRRYRAASPPGDLRLSVRSCRPDPYRIRPFHHPRMVGKPDAGDVWAPQGRVDLALPPSVRMRRALFRKEKHAARSSAHMGGCMDRFGTTLNCGALPAISRDEGTAMKARKPHRISGSRRAKAGQGAIVVSATLPHSQDGPAARRTCFVCGDPIADGVSSWAARAGAGLCSARPVLEVCSARCGKDPLWCGSTTCHAGW